MKKFIAFAAVCGFALAFVACGKKETAETTADTTAVEAPAPVVADTTQAADTTHTAADTAAAPAAH